MPRVLAAPEKLPERTTWTNRDSERRSTSCNPIVDFIVNNLSQFAGLVRSSRRLYLRSLEVERKDSRRKRRNGKNHLADRSHSYQHHVHRSPHGGGEGPRPLLALSGRSDAGGGWEPRGSDGGDRDGEHRHAGGGPRQPPPQRGLLRRRNVPPHHVSQHPGREGRRRPLPDEGSSRDAWRGKGGH